jgi:Putative zinc-finger
MTGREGPRGPGGDVMDCDAFREEMMDLLYGEAAPATARRLEEHQAACRACRDELDSFRRLRRELAAWPAPADLAGRSRWQPSVRPYLAVAAAVVLLVGGGFALRGSELRYEQGRIAFRLGQASEPAGFAAALAAQEERHRREMDALRVTVAQGSRSDEATLRKVQQMIADSEVRQASLVTTGLTRLEERTEARRQYDLAQVGAGLSYLDGKAGLQAARTTELVGHLLQASQKR